MVSIQPSLLATSDILTSSIVPSKKLSTPPPLYLAPIPKCSAVFAIDDGFPDVISFKVGFVVPSMIILLVFPPPQTPTT